MLCYYSILSKVVNLLELGNVRHFGNIGLYQWTVELVSTIEGDIDNDDVEESDVADAIELVSIVHCH